MPLWAQYISFGVAVAAFGLGVYNAWFSYRREATRFKVTPTIRLNTEGGKFLAIDVSNRGNSALYIESIWLEGGTKGTPPRWQLSVSFDVRRPGPFKDAIEARNANDYRVRIDDLQVPIERKMFTVCVYTKDGTVGKAFCRDLQSMSPELLTAIQEKNEAIERERQERKR